MKKQRYIFTLFILLLSAMNGWSQNSLDDYLKIAAENNSGLKAMFNTYLASLEMVPQVGALPDPQLAFGYFLQPIETRLGPQEFKISASQMFPWFGTLGANKNVATFQAKSKYEQFQEAKSKLFNDVRYNWYNLWFNKRAIEIVLENLQILHSFRELVLIKIESGNVSVIDAYRIEMEMGELENQLALMRDKQFVLQVSFNNLLNRDVNMLINIPDSLENHELALTKAAMSDSILSENHQLGILIQQSEVLNARKTVALKNGKPKFTIAMDYAFIGKGENNMPGTDAILFPMVGISIPLYRNKYKAMVEEVVYLQEANKQETENKTRVLNTLFENGWKDYSDAKRRIDLYERQMSLAEKSLSVLETDYSSGNRSFEEFLRMQRKLLGYHLENEKALADKQAAIAFLDYLMGKN